MMKTFSSGEFKGVRFRDKYSEHLRDLNSEEKSWSSPSKGNFRKEATKILSRISHDAKNQFGVEN